MFISSTVVYAQGWGILTLPFWGGEFDPGILSLFSGINVFQLLTWRCLKVKKLLSRADGSVEMVYKKVPDTSHVFTTKMAIKSSAWVGHLKPISPPGREFEQTNLHKFRWLEGCPKKGGGGFHHSMTSLNWSKHYYQINLNFLWFTVAINDRSGQPGCL